MKLFITFFIFLLFQSCINFYEDGMTVSVRTQKERLLTEWKVEKNIVNGFNDFALLETVYTCIYKEEPVFKEPVLEVYLKNNKTRIYTCLSCSNNFIEVEIQFLSDNQFKCKYIDPLGNVHQLELKKIRRVRNDKIY